MSWIQDIFDPKTRNWEDFYRNRWQHDRVVRSTHGVNCTGSCSWMVYVKNGIVTWELQATDYPKLKGDVPPYEPRGCQRGISSSWYVYSPLRIKYPYVRGALLDLWHEAKKEHGDPVATWEALMNDPTSRKRFQRARGKGGFRQSNWEESLDIIAASVIHTIKKYGPDRVIGFSPIPAMSMLSYAAGSRFLQLMGGVNLSFYDWYSDLPNASPETWGEQTDVAESADWYHSKFIATVGSNVSMTRTPDAHFLTEARHNGTKVVVFSPDFSMVSKNSDQWIPINAGQDGAFWQAVNHVILKEYYADNDTPQFTEYIKNFSDSPFLVILNQEESFYKAGRMLNASQTDKYKSVENPEFKFLVFDKNTNEVRMPKGSLGHRWQTEKGHWNLEMKDDLDGKEIDPVLSFIDDNDGTLDLGSQDFVTGKTSTHPVPVKMMDTPEGKVPVATVFDLLMAQLGVPRGDLTGDSYDDEDAMFTPAWQEQFTGINRKEVIRFAREWAHTAKFTGGKCSVIIGAGANHWYHNNMIYRSIIHTLVLTGCVGKNGGGLNHYVGQEKLTPMSSWASIAMGLDWSKPPRLMNAPSFHYVNSDQWRYEKEFSEYHNSGNHPLTQGHTMDFQVKAVRNGWLPSYPQFERSNLDLVKEAISSGAKEDKDVVSWIVKKLKDKELKFAVEDPDAEACWPRVFMMWRGNALMSSAKGHEYFLKHYLGTHTNTVAEDVAGDSVKEVTYREEAPEGKFDLVVDINFRMDTSALYSDIVLPTAVWYEKNDINTTDMHTYIHPLTAAVPPSWDSKSDWDIFKAFAKRVSELAETHLPNPIKDIVSVPLAHDTPDEMAQRTIQDWSKGECEPVPGKSMPKFVVVERDYTQLYKRFISYGEGPKKNGLGLHGLNWSVEDFYDELANGKSTEEWGGKKYPSLKNAVDAANVILHLAPETNGEIAYRAYEAEEKKTGRPLTYLAEGTREVRRNFENIIAQPRRTLCSPCWTGIVNDGRTYSSYCFNVENLVPWRTLTGRQHLYLDHEAYIAFGENLPTYKPKPDPLTLGELSNSPNTGDAILLNYLTPHGKWHIHSTFSDNIRMLTLSRGLESLWINDKDAKKIGVEDHDWVEVYNDNGVVVTRAAVSARIPPAVCFHYHAPERTLSVPKSPLRKNRRAGSHNSLVRARLKPLLMVGGYGQFTYGFNYWGPTGVTRDTYTYVRKLEGEPQWT